ncbi:MAG: indolepyruvate oxidoreductase subunit beta, partial [Oscillospiraceae bacterium]|nr:indolepyruvate oxidoreductase subunit beta [Oscillospiraceae bacterium]
MNILIVGVGGQGTLLASKVLGRVYLSQGLDVKVGEVHGMSQRGGSVVTYVRAGERVGERVFSPVIERGEADVILAFEPLEAARWLPYLKTDGTVIASTQVLYPMPVLAGTAAYPA